MPAIEDVTLEDVLADGRELGRTPAEIAGAVRKWRGLTLDWAAQNRAGADPERYAKGVDALDTATDAALRDLRGVAARQWAESTFASRPQDYPAFLSSLEAGDVPNDPYATEKQQFRELQQAFRVPKARQANQWEPLADRNGIELGRMQFIDRGAEQDVLLNLRTDTTGGRKALHVPIKSVQDAEIEQAAVEAEQKAAKFEEEAVYHLSFPAETGYNGSDAANIAEKAALQQTLRAKTLRGPQGRSLLTSERVMQAVRENPALSKQVGQRGLGEDFYRGLAQFFVSSRVAFNDVTGDTAERDEWRGHLQNLRQYFPGSTGPANTEGAAGFVSDAVSAAGGMVQQMLAMAGGPLLGSAVLSGVGAASLGSMGVSSYGGAVDEALSRADAMEADAEKLAATDPQGAQQLREQAAGIREGYRGIAAAKAGVEMASELILPEHRLLTSGASGALKRVGSAAVKNFGEGAAAEIGNQAVNWAVFGDAPDLAQVLRAGALEAAAGAPMIAASALARTNPNDNVSTNETPAAPAPEMPGGTMLQLATTGGAGMQAPVPKRQPILTGVPDRVPLFRDRPLDQGVPLMEGDVITDLRVPRSPEAIAESQRIERERESKIAEMRMLDARAQGMPVIPDSPSGSRDILDFANENPIYLPPGFSEERNAPEYEKLKQNALPAYWRQFIASSKRGGNPGDIAQRAFDAGFIAEPTADAYFEALREGIAGRKQYRVQFAEREKALQQEEKRVVDFEKTQNKLAKKPDAQQVAFEDIVPGDKMTIDGESAVVRNVEHNEDGYLTNVVIEDGKRFGLMQFDPQTRGGLLVDEFKPQGTTASTPATAPAAAPAATNAADPAGRLTSDNGTGASRSMPPNAEAGNLDALNAELQMAGGFTNLDTSGRTAGFLNTEILAEAEALIRRGLTNFAQWSRAMVARFGEAIREFLQGVWRQVTSPQTNAARNVRLGMPQGTAPVSVGAGGFVGGGAKKDQRTSAAIPPQAATDALKLISKRLPGLQGGRLLVFPDAAALLASGYDRGRPFTSAELAGMEGAEAFFDNLTGRTVLFTSQIGVREGETPMRAVARVLLHERVGHEGVNFLLQSDAAFAKQWAALSAQIPAAALDGIAAEPGYAHLAADRAQLALEWLARQAEADAVRVGSLPQRMLAAVKAWLERFFEAFSRKKSLDAEVRALLGKAREAALNGTADATSAGALAAQLGIQMSRPSAGSADVTLRERLRRTLIQGSPLPKALHEVVQSTDRERAALDARAAQIGRDLDAAAVSYAERSGAPLAQVYDMVNDALSGAPGTTAVLMQLDPALNERTHSARVFLDGMSVAVAQTMPVSPLRNAILMNQGSWMRRSYAAFDPASGWNYDNVMAAAKAGQMLGGKDAAKIVRAAETFLRAQGPNAPRTPSEIERDMRDLMDRDVVGNALAGSAAVRKSVSSVLARKEIPSELRALMGEEQNPVKRFAQSANFQAQFIHRHQQQVTLRALGLASGLFSERSGDRYRVQAPTEGQAWSGLNGIWMEPQTWQDLQSLHTTEGNSFPARLGEAVKWLGNEAKLNRVAMNPDSWFVNLLGNVTSLVLNGDVFYGSFFRRVGEAVSLHRSGKAKAGDVVNAALDAVNDAQRALLAKLTAAGVAGQNFSTGDLQASIPRHFLAWVEQDSQRMQNRLLGAVKGAIAGQGAGRGLGIAGRVAGAAAGAATGGYLGYARVQELQQKLADYVMMGPDAIARLTGFLGNYEVALAAGLAPDAAFADAAERTRDTFPDYGRLPAALKTLSRYGAAASFVGFQYEVYRNTIHAMRYAISDLRSGNRARTRKGLARVAGLSTLGILSAGGLQAMFSGLGAGEDERSKKFRKWFAAPWEKNGVLIFTNYGPEGVSYFNTSYLVPQATIVELWNAAASGADPMEAAGNVAAHFWEQFLGASVAVDPLLNAYKNTDRMGRPISLQSGLPGVAERLDSAMQPILEPGWAQKLERLEYAAREAEKNGRQFSFEEEMKRVAGMREFTRRWNDLVKRGYDNLAREGGNIRQQANKELGLNLPGAQASALEKANAALTALNAQVAAYEADLAELGIPPAIIKAARKDSSLPKTFRALEPDPENRRRVRSQ